MTGVTMASEHEDLHGYYDALNEAERRTWRPNPRD